MIKKLFLTLFALSLTGGLAMLFLPLDAGYVDGLPDGCTSITVGKLASTDGSVMTSHTCDSREDRTWIDIQPARKYKTGEKEKVYKNTEVTLAAYDLGKREETGEIDTIPETFAFLNTVLPPMNNRQLAVGESTFGGKDVMRSDKGIIDYYELNRLMVQRAKTAREAIRVADEITKQYGYNDGGECFTIADPNEVWHFEIVGPGKGKIGAVWAARRVPDGEISVNANASRIRKIDLKNPDYYMASDNVFSTAIEMGLWNPDSGEPFEFCYAYADRNSMGSRRREWRVLDLAAPGLKLDPYAENYPFSVKPEKKISVKWMMETFRDTFEGTEFDMTKYWIVEERDKDGKPTGKLQKSPYANPFMDYDMMPLMKVNGGWDWRGERCIARYYCTYVTVTQSRSWLPDAIGGLVWFGWDNPAMTAYAPLYCSITDVPASYKISGREKYRMDCSWWAFNRVADLAAQKWGDMRKDVAAARDPIEAKGFEDQLVIEAKALELYKKNPKKAVEFLTNYSNEYAKGITKAWWDLGDAIWTKYTGKF
jgi:dipeptidase